MILFGYYASKRALLNTGHIVSFYKWEVLSPLICFAVVFGMRYGVGTDYLTYLDIYNTEEYANNYEWGFKWITMFFAKNNFHFSVYFTVFAFLQVFFFFSAFKDERYLYPYLAFVLFAGGYYLAWMNAIRQDLAACIFIYSIKYIIQNKFFKYLTWCLIAALFHRSAIILIVLYPLLKNGRDYLKSISLQLIILGVALFLYYSGFRIEYYFGPQIEAFTHWIRYGFYTIEIISNTLIETNTGIGFLLAVIIDVIIILYSDKMKNYFNSKLFVIIYILYFVGIIAEIVVAGSIVLARPFRYFTYFKLIVAGYLIYYLFKNAKLSFNQLVLFLVVVLYCMLFGALLYRGETNTSQFQFFWQANI